MKCRHSAKERVAEGGRWKEGYVGGRAREIERERLARVCTQRHTHSCAPTDPDYRVVQVPWGTYGC